MFVNLRDLEEVVNGRQEGESHIVDWSGWYPARRMAGVVRAMRQRWTGSWKSFLILRIWHGHLLGMDCSRWLRVVTLSIGFCNCLEPSLECFGDFLEELLRVWGMVTGILGRCGRGL